MSDGGRRNSNPQPPADKRSNPSCSLGSPQYFMRCAIESERPGQKSARRLALAGYHACTMAYKVRYEVPLPAAPDAHNTHSERRRETKVDEAPRGATSSELAKYLRPAASRRTEPEYPRCETRCGKGPHLRTLAGALPLLGGTRWKGETKYPYLAASRRAAYVHVCEASRQAPARNREKTKYPCPQPRGNARIIARSPA
jgi:hypothetical protein